MTKRPTRRRDLGGASEQVAVEIQHHIQDEGLGPDDFLGREEDLAAQFGVSRPTLREALRLLASGNLIRASKGPGGGIFVARTPAQAMSRTVSDAIAMMAETGAVTPAEFAGARLMLEVPLAGLAARRADEAALARLNDAVAAEAALADDPDALAAADLEIHRAIASAGATGNRLLQALTGWMFDLAGPAAAHAAEVEQHRAIVAAIEKGDAPGAERAMRDHLLHLRDSERDG